MRIQIFILTLIISAVLVSGCTTTIDTENDKILEVSVKDNEEFEPITEDISGSEITRHKLIKNEQYTWAVPESAEIMYTHRWDVVYKMHENETNRDIYVYKNANGIGIDVIQN